MKNLSGKKAIARETFSLGQMINKGRMFYLRKGSLGRVKLCNTDSNQSCIAELPTATVEKLFEIVS